MLNKDFFEIYCLYSSHNHKYSAYITFKKRLRKYFIEPYGEEEVSAISPPNINYIYNQMSSIGLSQNSILGMRSALQNYFNYAIDQNETKSNPVNDSKPICQLRGRQ